MTTIKATEARANLYKLLDQAGESHEPIQITGKRSNAILISEDDWRSIQETLYLLSIPGMRESIRKGLKMPVRKCSGKPQLGSGLFCWHDLSEASQIRLEKNWWGRSKTVP